MKLIDVEIEGTRALLMHRFGEQAQEASKATTRKTHIQRKDPREEAEKCAYRLPSGALYMPGAAIMRAVREAAGNHKQRGSRKSMKYAIAPSISPLDECLPLVDPKTGEPIANFEVYSTAVVIPATKGRVMRDRPRINAWAIKFAMEIDEEYVDVETIHELLQEAGKRYGIGDFRIEKFGPFGSFRVTKFKERPAEKKAA